jgi:gamma-glutamyltranspeptidase/glutathione hydrolase
LRALAFGREGSRRSRAWWLLALALCARLGASALAAPGAVVTDEPLAAAAGLEMLKKGGNAVDAAVAAGFALGVVDPASSGIGGGGFIVIFQSREKKTHALDFRERAPAAAERGLYLRGGKPAPSLSLSGGLAVAVPGQVAGLLEAHRRFGRLSLAAVLAPAIQYAAEGFPLRAPLRRAIESQLDAIRKSPQLARLFLKPDGAPLDEDSRIVQPELAESLRSIAAEGAAAFYRGWIAQAIVEEVKREGGVLALEDLREYRPVWRAPLIGSYRQHLIVTMPPPSSGGVALLRMLNVLEGYPLAELGHNSATYLHLLAEVMKHAFAARAQYLGDPDFVKMPLASLLSKADARALRDRISAVKTHPPEFYGRLPHKGEAGGTTHFSVLDREGNAVSCTLTINTRFGSKLMAPGTGIILNNEMDDFSIHPGLPNVYGLVGVEPNALQPKKRPLSSMTPTIVLRGGEPFLILGAAGGPRIINATLQTLLNVVDFSMPLERAIAEARIHHQWLPNELAVESDIPAPVRRALERRGHAVRERDGLGTVQAILVRDGKVYGQADPRKDERGRASR